MKDELKWIPILYLVHKTVDMPFLKRHSMKSLKKNPELRKLDMIAAQKAAKELLSRYDAKIARVQPTIYTSQPELQSEFFNLIKS